MLNENVGTIEQSGERQIIRGSVGKDGHIAFGPYIELAPGSYRVTFDISPTDVASPPADICGIIDIVHDYGQREIAVAAVRNSDLAVGRTLALDFDLDHAVANCEFRVWVNGRQPLLVSDVSAPERRAGPCRFGVQTQAEPGLAAILKRLWADAVPLEVTDGIISLPLENFEILKTQILETYSTDFAGSNNRTKLAEMVVGSVGYRGCSENSIFRAFVGTDKPLVSAPERVPFTSSLCHQTHFGYEQYRFWATALKEQPVYQRKQWEFVFIAQTLFERGYLNPGKKGLVFGAGEEQLPALFASFGAEVLATDQAPDMASASGWASSRELTYDLQQLNQRSICTQRMFSDLVSFRPVDMNAIPDDLDGQFDFCWSACALEHLGSLQHGIDFVENAMRTLRPGGLAVHTTEFNLSSNEDTIETENLSIYRKRDIQALVNSLTSKGYEVAPIDWDFLGEGFAEMVVDLAPFLARGEPHLRLRIGQYDCTSIGLIIEKPSSYN